MLAVVQTPRTVEEIERDLRSARDELAVLEADLDSAQERFDQAPSAGAMRHRDALSKRLELAGRQVVALERELVEARRSAIRAEMAQAQARQGELRERCAGLERALRDAVIDALAHLGSLEELRREFRDCEVVRHRLAAHLAGEAWRPLIAWQTVPLESGAELQDWCQELSAGVARAAMAHTT
jgi:chromosome segregation ATPase